MQSYRVLLAEDRIIHRGYFENLLSRSERYILSGTESSMEGALQFCGNTPVDLIVTEAADRAGKTCFKALAECKRKYPHIRIVVVTDMPEYSFPERAEKSGADSFWYSEGRQSLLTVLDHTMEGKSVFPVNPPIVKIGQAKSIDFSAKELQILREVAKGYSNKEIAVTIKMSYYTVRDYVKGMLEKTHLQSRTELAVEAVSSGIILLEKDKKTVR